MVRRLGLGDAVVIGLASMIGAGVFAAFAPATRAAGAAVLLALVIAAAIAFCNAVASAQLAAVYPVSGGTYIYGRERLGPWWGFAAGWGFVIGKTASCAAIALTAAAYLAPASPWAQHLIAAFAVIVFTLMNLRGISRTVAVGRVLVAITLVCLAGVVTSIAASGHADPANLAGWASPSASGVHGLLQAAGLLFFAFAGYARIATLGEEVRTPERTIPRAIPLALGLTVVIYAVVGVSVLSAAGPAAIAASSAPLITAVEAVGAGGLTPVVTIGAAVAALGSLLALIAGVGRTSLAMARNRDLPVWLAAVHPRTGVPHRAELVLGAIVVILVTTTDLRGAIGFSSFGVLSYYMITNLSALTQPAAQRRWPRALNVLGACGCVVLAVSLPLNSVLAGAAVIGVGLVARLVLRREDQPRGAAGSG